MKLEHQYSGPKSDAFWKVVNSLPREHLRELYSLGCALQDLEGRVLSTLQLAKPNTVKKKRL